MANIDISFNTTAKQDLKLAKILATVNADRIQQELPPFDDITTYLRFIVIETVKAYVKRQNELDVALRASAYDAASDEIKAQVDTILGL
jgi:hypothetical protein